MEGSDTAAYRPALLGTSRGRLHRLFGLGEAEQGQTMYLPRELVGPHLLRRHDPILAPLHPEAQVLPQLAGEVRHDIAQDGVIGLVKDHKILVLQREVVTDQDDKSVDSVGVNAPVDGAFFE